MQTNLLKLSLFAFFFALFISSLAQQSANLKDGENQATGITKKNAPMGWHKSIEEVVFYEDFSAGLDAWTIQGEGSDNWGIVQTNVAGGAIPEVRLYWNPSFLGTSRLVSPAINTSGYTQLSLSFLHFVDSYAFNTGFWVSVETTSDGGATWNQVWELNWLTGDNYNAFEVLIVNTPDIGSANFQFCFKFEDDSYQIDQWNIDNVTLGEQAFLDVTPLSISGFENLIHEGDVVNISSEIANYGSEIVSFDVILEIYEGSNIVFSSVKSVSNLAFGEPATVAFDPWTAVMGFYTAYVTTLLPGDENPDNDQIELAFPVVDANWYCVPVGDCFSPGGFITGITDFAFSGIENYNSGCSNNGYGVFTNQEGTAEIGSDYVATVAVGFQNQYVSIWIDLNQDIEFTPDELVVTDFEMAEGGVFYEIPISIPGHGLPGATVMRVGSCFLQPSSPDPCANLWAGEWEDYTLILTGSSINLDAGVVSIDMDPFLLQGKVIPKATVKNFGLQTVSFPVTCNINDNGYTSTKNVTDLALGEEFQVVFDTWTAEPGNYDVEVTTQLAGDEVPANNMLNTTVGIVESIPPKMVVGEEGTGTWCGWCPEGIVVMEHMAETYPDTWIGIAVHNNDPMVVPEYDAGILNYLVGYPSGLIDRSGVAYFPGQFEEVYQERINKVAPAELMIENQSFTNGILTFDVTATFYAMVSNYRLNAVLVEDYVTGTSAGYNQANFYSGGAYGEMGGFELLPNPVPAADMIYMDVARALLGGWDGVEGSLPEIAYAGETYSFEFSVAIDESWDHDNMRIVGMLINNNNGMIQNACVKTDITGVPSLMNSSGISVYPNPVKDKLTISTKSNADVYLFDINGQLIMLEKSISGAHQMDVSSLENGTYIIKVVGNNQPFVTKVIILNNEKIQRGR